MLLFVALTSCMLPTAESRATLVLSIDPVAMTYQLTGSETLTPFVGDDSDFALWGIDSGVGFGALTFFDNTTATSSPNTLSLTRLRLFDTAADLILDYGSGGTPEQTITGNGQAYSYASASSTQKTYLENIIGQSLSPQFGLVANPIVVVQVPEPSSACLLALGMLVVTMRRLSNLPASI